MKLHTDVASIILARGGSKGIPGKNMISFCGKPLLEWTILQMQDVWRIDHIWVSSDDDKILRLADDLGCETIKRPVELSTDFSTSESCLIHAMDFVRKEMPKVDLIVHPQVTSPIRESDDVLKAIELMDRSNFDSLFSASPAKDLCLWSVRKGNLKCESYDVTNPCRRRQETFGERYIENGSFYLIEPEVLDSTKLRFGKNVGIQVMEFWKMFEIDEPEDLKLCTAVMTAFLGGLLK